VKGGRDAVLRLLRNQVIRVQTVADVVERVDELETGAPEQRRQAPALNLVVDGLERDVMRVVAARLEREDARG